MKSIKIKNATKKGYLEACEGDGVDLAMPSSLTRRGRVQPQMAQTLDCAGGATKGVVVMEEKIRIRKLTPKECWRAMGFKDEEHDEAKKVNSDTQLYKQAGNSIVVDVLVAIFKELL